MFPRRAVGYLRVPTPEQIAAYAARHHLDLRRRRSRRPNHRLPPASKASPGSRSWSRPHPRDYGIYIAIRAVRPAWRKTRTTLSSGSARYGGSAEGSLAGKTIGVKDCIAVAGVPLTNGGRRTPAVVPIEDAVVVERLLDTAR